MSCVQLSEGVSRWFTPLACGPGHPELSKSYMDMASKLFTFIYIYMYMQCMCTTECSAVKFALSSVVARSCRAGASVPSWCHDMYVQASHAGHLTTSWPGAGCVNG